MRRALLASFHICMCVLFCFSHWGDSWNFRDLPQLLDGSYTAVVNNAKVDNCKLLVDVPGGGREIIYVLGDGATPQFAGLVNNTALEGVYVISGDCLDRLPEGEALVVAEADGRHIEVEIVHRATSGTAVALFSKESDSDESLQAAVQAVAQVPLPPYIASLEGEKRYQTVFAEASGSVAAPTASLHFTEKVLEELRELEVCWHALRLFTDLVSDVAVCWCFPPGRSGNLLTACSRRDFVESSSLCMWDTALLRQWTFQRIFRNITCRSKTTTCLIRLRAGSTQIGRTPIGKCWRSGQQ